jgi:ATP-dependent helicase/nuclease subunit A
MEIEPKEEAPLAKPFTPSRPDDEEEPDSSSPLQENTNYYRRGSLIHKILQFLPADDTDKEVIIEEYMQKNAADFSADEQKQIKEEILRLLAKEEYAMLFGADSRAEVSVFGEVNGKIISAKIDRLVVLDNKVVIVDFKTNRPAGKSLEETPEVYKKQLKDYETLLRRIYPQHNIESYILWTNDARLMRVS